jgi:hypothetical protein
MTQCLTLLALALCFNACVNNQQENLQEATSGNVSSPDSMIHVRDSVFHNTFVSVQYDTVIIDSKSFVASRQDGSNLVV